MQNTPLFSAEIDAKVKRYWLVQTFIICFFGVFTILLLPIIIPIVMVCANKYLGALSVQLYERKLSVKKGVFVKIEKSVPLEKITDISLVQGPLMRLFDIYKLNFETAGQSGDGALISVTGINDAEQFRERVLAQKDAISGVNIELSSAETDADPLLQSVQNIEALLKQLLKQKRTD